ncbi:fumarylacetoacetate hydrolase family protein, partial [Arthrobacter bambusae]|uniref:fumarylacetoacetate hydrolase family protein n=1 Tax=Arthrobacter bambusae TaxID=1338426 RepID=UPI001F50A7C4
TLKPGDLIFTGTPAGVSTITPGDTITGGIDNIGTFTITIGPKSKKQPQLPYNPKPGLERTGHAF